MKSINELLPDMIEKINRKSELYNSLCGETLQEKYEDLQMRIFSIDMIDRWSENDRLTYKLLSEIEKEMEEELENGK